MVCEGPRCHAPVLRWTATPLTQDPALANSWATMASSACPLGAVGPARASVKESVELSDDMLRCKTLLAPRPSKPLRVVAFKTNAVLAPLCPGPPDPEEAGVGVLEAEVEADPSMEGTGSGADAGVVVAVSDVVAGGAAVPVAGVVVADVVMDEVVINVAVVEDSPVESPLGEVSLEGASTSWMTTVPDLSAEASRDTTTVALMPTHKHKGAGILGFTKMSHNPSRTIS